MGSDPLLAHGYTTISPIANGAFSQIVRARHQATGTEVAVKTFSRAVYAQPSNAHLATSMRNELSVLLALKQASHPHLANIVEVLENRSAIIAILEYCGGGSLHRALQKAGACDRPHAFGIGQPMAMRVAMQVASALAHLHSEGVAHRDVKPQNVLFVDVASARVKLCDFGFAIACGGKKVRTVCGTPQYMAPEIANAPMDSRRPYGAYEVDLWAYGAMVFEMLEGRPAFSGASMPQLNMRILRAHTNDFTEKTPPPAKALVKALLQVDPAKRMVANDALNHAWFAQLASEVQATSAHVRPMVAEVM